MYSPGKQLDTEKQSGELVRVLYESAEQELHWRSEVVVALAVTNEPIGQSVDRMHWSDW
jgi:hypothetical protein